ncbi:hypothetical protein TNCV_674401 [Trichonephila clavipes]|nr:hypothetical protein TNCV_674401 [Trichonephila clavipes]
MRACCIRRSSQLLVCQGCPEPDHRVTNRPLVHWSQHLLAVKSERPRRRTTPLADNPISIFRVGAMVA